MIEEKRLEVLQLALQSMITASEELEKQVLEHGPVTPGYYEVLEQAKRALELSNMSPEEYVDRFGVNLKEEKEQKLWLV